MPKGNHKNTEPTLREGLYRGARNSSLSVMSSVKGFRKLFHEFTA